MTDFSHPLVASQRLTGPLPILLLALLLGGCGAGSPISTAAVASAAGTPAARATVPVAVPTPTAVPVAPTVASTPGQAASATPATNKGTALTAGTRSITLYFTQGGHLVGERRTVSGNDVAAAALDALLAGPRIAGHYSEVPTGTRLLGLQIHQNAAVVNFSQQLRNLQGEPAIPLFLAQLVDTLTQFPTVHQVELQIEGRAVRSLGGEGVPIPRPLDRAAVSRLLAQANG